MKKNVVKLSAFLLLMFPSLVSAETVQKTIDTQKGSEIVQSSMTSESTTETSSTSNSESESISETSSSSLEESTSSSTTDTSATESTDSSEEKPDEDEISFEAVENKFITVINKEEHIWKEINKETIGTTESLFNRTFSVKEIATTKKGKIYYLLFDKDDKKIGYVLKEALKEAEGAQGIWQKNDQFVSLNDNNIQIYQNFDWKIKEGRPVKDETLHAKGVYSHLNGNKYFSIYNKDNKWLGYVEEKNVSIAAGKQGLWRQMDEYVSVTKKNYSIWQNFGWKEKNNTTNLFNQTLHVKGYYNHFNGSIYYSLYDGNGNWKGYVNKNAVTKTSVRQGPWIKTSKYVTISNKNYSTYSNFNWQVRHNGTSLVNRTFKVTGRYEHLNGSTYYSLYDNNNKWFGYINKKGVKEGGGRQGAYIPSKDFVTVTKGNYSVWQNFNWKKKKSSSALQNKTYQVKGFYKHMNGDTYYSLYDNKGTWQGYLNATGAKVAPGKQGIWFGMNKQGTIAKGGYTTWQNFNWQKKGSTNSMLNKKYRVGGYYNHFNGDTYFSLYDNSGKWQGYLNSSAVRFKTTVSDYMGTTPDRVLNNLKRHEHDGFYVGTPFRGLSYDAAYSMSPRGRSNGYGPGMNCTGFVAYAYQDGGANLNKITQVANAWGGAANAYNWRDALTKNTDYETFGTIGQLLSSGKAKKGDIIYLEADFSKPGPDPHIGIFWGDYSSHNRFFHATWPATKISEIYSYTPYSKVYLFSL